MTFGSIGRPSVGLGVDDARGVNGIVQLEAYYSGRLGREEWLAE